MLLGPGDPIGGVQPGQHELDARGPHRRIAGGVHLERLVPGRRHALQPLGVVARRQHVADLDLHALAKRSRRSRPGRAGRRIPRTPSRIASAMIASSTCRSRHLVAAHQVELQLAERRRVEVAQVADPRHGRLLAEHAPRCRALATIVR